MLIVGAYLASELSRGFAHSTADTAIGHAHDVVSIEKHVGLFHEAGVQSFAHSVPGLTFFAIWLPGGSLGVVSR